MELSQPIPQPPAPDLDSKPFMPRYILNMRVDVVKMAVALARIREWVAVPSGRYICAANVHMCMEVWDCKRCCIAVNGADLVVPDSRVMMWALRLLGEKSVSQVRGADFLFNLCLMASKEKIRVGLYGGSDEGLQAFIRYAEKTFPELEVVCAISPPFHPLTAINDDEYIERICKASPQLLLIGLGCPKQELWMARHRDRLPCVMVGFGAAFDFLSGRIKSAPVWMQKAGLEWLFRLASDPHRLWKRYLKHNPRFIYHFGRQLFKRGMKSTKLVGPKAPE